MTTTHPPFDEEAIARRQAEEQPQTPRQLAKWLLRPYVLRGDPYQQVRLGGGSYGGALGVAYIALDDVYVTRLGPWDWGEHLQARFKLRELWAELLDEAAQGVEQQALP